MTISLPIFTRTQTAETTPFDGASLGLASTNLQDAIRELASSNFSQLNFEYVVLTEEDIAAKSVRLSKQPSSNLISVDVVGGTTQMLGSDFILSGRDLLWASKGLDGLLEDGDILRILYATEGVTVEHHEITETEFALGEFELQKTPYFADAVMLDIVGGSQQYPGLDFSVEGQKIVFRGFNLQTLVEPGDIARIIYQSY